ncbi:MAG: hypothetical protein ACYTGX_18430 [Planctomycetota bacterium]|jgi:hypothetical protein
MRLLTPTLLAAGLCILTGCPKPAAPPAAKTWTGHVVRFHLPVDVGLGMSGDATGKLPKRAWAGGPKVDRAVEVEEPILEGETPAPARRAPAAQDGPAKLLLRANGLVRVGGTRLDDWSADAPAAIGKAVKALVAQGTAELEIDAEAEVPAWHVIAAVAACRANGIADPSLAAGRAKRPDFHPHKKDDADLNASFVAPPLPRIAGAEARELPEQIISTASLDPTAKDLIVGAPGRPYAGLSSDTVARHLKGQAARFPAKGRPELSELCVLVWVHEEVPWSWLAWMLTECAKAGIWKIEVVVEPGK